jgi:hypothetical protein
MSAAVMIVGVLTALSGVLFAIRFRETRARIQPTI